MPLITRFAPSPTGLLHLGHAYAACRAFDMAQAAGGTCLLRIEDTDRARCRPEFETALIADLHWLGCRWPEPPMRQSERGSAYAAALQQLSDAGLVYPCSCTRGDIRRALGAPQEGDPPPGPDGPVYPGTCRGRAIASARPGDALRLDMTRATDRLGAMAIFTETGGGTAEQITVSPADLIQGTGDIVLARRQTGEIAYHLAVVVDDAAQNITHVLRGRDLLPATPIHVLLQTLLGLPTPVYHHHRLIRDETGKRLAKRDDARAISRYRAEGATPDDIRRMVGLPPGTRHTR